MIDKYYNENMYLNFYDLNPLENSIYDLTEEISDKTSIPTYIKKEWKLNDFPWIEDIKRIEEGIENLGLYFYKPSGWIPTKKWLINGNKSAFIYDDINRWINNINLIYEHKNEKFTIWNGIPYINWNEVSEFEWEE